MAIETIGAALGQIHRLWADGTITGFSDAQLLERFVSGHDVAAFEALVAHHGPMVLGVCRGILKDPNDAEDAFQATFLILVKKSGTLRRHEALGPWLYQVAHRVALRANAAAIRRRACERRAGLMAATTAVSGPSAPDESLQALHEEIARLPEKFRRAVILCELQRVPQAQAAAELRLSERTLQRRLSQGRERLKARLIRRGLAPEGAALGSAFLGGAHIAVPPAWGQAVVRAALATVDHSLTAGVVSAAAQELTREVLRIMLVQKLTLAASTLLAAGLIVWVASAALVSLPEEPAKKIARRADPPSPRETKAAVPQPGLNPVDPSGKVTVSGRVLAPDGRPVPGAKIYRTPFTGNLRRSYPSHEFATTGPDGHFEFLADKKAELTHQDEKYLFERTVVTAAAPSFGVAWVEVLEDGRSDDLTLQLVDDEPITGQIVGLEGKPVPGATLQVLEIRAAAGEDLGPWLEAVKAKKRLGKALEGENLARVTIALSPKVATDAEGRFQLTGMGRNRLVMVQLDGPKIVSEHLNILTRPGEAISVVEFERPSRVTTTYYGANFRHAAAPTKPIVGVVRDKDTKLPLAGITIRSHKLANNPVGGNHIVQTTTDAQGRYRLTGMPKGEGNFIQVVPGRDQPYLISLVGKDVPDSPGLDPVTADIELKRGIWIEGRITDKVTGKPLLGHVSYFAQPNNANTNDYAPRGIVYSRAGTNEDGSYRVAGMPGPGFVVVDYERDYLRATQRDDEFGVKETFFPTVELPLINYIAVARVDAATGVESVKRDVTLDPGWTFTGTVLGPDGQPLAGTWGIGLTGYWWERDRIKTAEFTVSGFNPHRPRDLLFQQPEKGLAGVARPPKDKGNSITVKLQPGAAVTGRLVDSDGRPRASVALEVSVHSKEGPAWPAWSRYSAPEDIKTDREGRFRIDALLPGYEFRLSERNDNRRGDLRFGDGLGSGQTKDLGDVQIKGQEP